jgi:hypothetical protein
MKRIIPALIFSFTILLFGSLTPVNFVTANPIWLGEVPPDADTKHPYITIFSPENNSFCNSSISINLKVSVGESTSALSTKIDTICYNTDWIENNITVYNGSINPKHTWYSTILNLTDIPEGNHSITIYAIERGTYNGSGLLQYYTFHTQNSAMFSFSSNILSSPTPTVPEFSWLTILPILLAIPIVLITVRKRLKRNF